jgi:hypothetical protein
MTIAVGFMLGNAAVLCADSQEVVSDYAKTTTQKIQTMHSPGKWRFGLVGAGDAACIELCNEELVRKISAVQDFDYSRMLDIIRSTVHEVHEQHVWPRQSGDRPSFQLLIALQGVNPGGRSLLFTQDSIVLPVDHFKSIGVGCYLADYLHDRIYPSIGSVYKSSAEEAARAGIFILDQVKSAIHGCDGETLVAMFHGDGTFRWVVGTEVHEIESWFSAFHSSELSLLQTVINAELDKIDYEQRLLQLNADMRLLRARQAKDAKTHAERFAEFLRAQKKATKKSPKP